MEEDYSPTPSSQFDEDSGDDFTDDAKDEDWDFKSFRSREKAQSSALDATNSSVGKPTPAFPDAVFEFLAPYAKYLGCKTSKKGAIYDLIEREVLMKYPEFEGPRLRVRIQSSWNRFKSDAVKKYSEKMVLNKRDRIVLKALGHRLHGRSLRAVSEERKNLPKSPAYNNTWTAAICEIMEPFVTKMKVGRDEETDRLWDVITEKVAEQFPELRAERKTLKRRMQNLFRNFRKRALIKKRRGKVLTDHQIIACKYGGEGAEQMEFDVDEAMDDDGLDEDENSCSSWSPVQYITLSAAICNIIEPFVTRMKFGRDKETSRLWDFVAAKVAEQFPHLSDEQKSKCRVRALFKDTRKRALLKKAAGKPLTEHQQIALRFGGGEQKHMEFDPENPLHDNHLDEDESCSNSSRTINLSSDSQYSGTSKFPAICNVKMEDLEGSLSNDALNRMSTNEKLAELAKASAETTGLLTIEESDENQDEPGPSTSREPKSRADTASEMEADGSLAFAMEEEQSMASSSSFHEDSSDDSSENAKNEHLDSTSLRPTQKDQSSASGKANAALPTPAFHDAVFEFIIPYAKYLGNRAAKKGAYYDLIEREVLKKYPQFEGPRLRSNIQSVWNGFKSHAEKKYFEKLVLNKRDRMILEALGHRLDLRNLRRPSEERKNLPKTAANNNTWTAVICETMEPFITKMKFGRDEETDRLWGIIANKVAEQFPELRTEKKLKRRIQNLFRNFRTRALGRRAMGKMLTDHQEIACLYGSESAEQNQTEFGVEDPTDNEPREGSEPAVGDPQHNPDPRNLSEDPPSPPQTPVFMPTLTTAVCEAIEPFVTKMKFGRDEETDRLWGVVLEKVSEQFPEISNDRKSKRRVRCLFQNIRIRALRKRALGQTLTEHQAIACRYGGEGDEQNQMEFDLDEAVDDDPLEAEEICHNTSRKTETVKVSSGSRGAGPSKSAAIFIVKKKDLSRLDSESLDRIQMQLNALVDSAKASAEPTGILAEEESEKKQDEPGTSSRLEPESRAEAASTETNSLNNTNKSLPLSQWLKIVDFCQRSNQDFFLEGNHLVFTDRNCRTKILRVPMDRVCPE